MWLDERILRLIAVGASISASCQPCLQINLEIARENGADDQEIAAAIWVGTMVKLAEACQKGKIAAGAIDPDLLLVGAPPVGCACRDQIHERLSGGQDEKLEETGPKF